MTDASLPDVALIAHGNRATASHPSAISAIPWRSLLLATTIASAIAGFVVASPGAASDTELTTLLRFMAGVKALLVLASLALLTWRLGRPTTAPLALSYVVSAALMSVSIGLIWQIAFVATGALAFHVGMLLLLGAACADPGKIVGHAKATASRPGGRR